MVAEIFPFKYVRSSSIGGRLHLKHFYNAGKKPCRSGANIIDLIQMMNTQSGNQDLININLKISNIIEQSLKIIFFSYLQQQNRKPEYFFVL